MHYRYMYPDNPNGLKQGQDYEVVAINEGDQGLFATVIVNTPTGPEHVKELTSHFRRSASPTHVKALPESRAAKVFGLTAMLYIYHLEIRHGVRHVRCKVVGAGITQPSGHRETFILHRNFTPLDE